MWKTGGGGGVWEYKHQVQPGLGKWNGWAAAGRDGQIYFARPSSQTRTERADHIFSFSAQTGRVYNHTELMPTSLPLIKVMAMHAYWNFGISIYG